MFDDDLYTEEVKKEIYQAKARLPEDFALETRTDEIFIIIMVDMSNFAWRTVEDRLEIAVELEKLKSAIERLGIRCLIEKVA